MNIAKFGAEKNFNFHLRLYYLIIFLLCDLCFPFHVGPVTALEGAGEWDGGTPHLRDCAGQYRRGDGDDGML